MLIQTLGKQVQMPPTLATKIYSITELNQTVKSLLESKFNSLWISGEISNLSKPSSGHLYFSLKDNKAQIRCALFRGYQNPNLPLKDGQQILVQANVSLYAARGDFQLIVTAVYPAGDGLLQIKFEKLKAALKQQGLFEPAHKHPLPQAPKQIGIITSSTGAALQDILKILKRRCPLVPIIIYPTLVQGAQACQQITTMIDLANQRGECDVLIIARGGGSLEDLWPFNEEMVAHSIYASTIPIVAGIGHETDISIADYVADVRAATPSAAAEIVAPDQSTWFTQLQQHTLKLNNLINQYIEQMKSKINNLHKRLRHPQQTIQDKIQHLDQLEKRIHLIMHNTLERKQTTFHNLIKQLHTLSPLNTLGRGYAIVSTADNTQVIDRITKVNTNQSIQVKLVDGQLHCQVNAVEKNKA